MKYIVAMVDEIPSGQRKIVVIAGRSIGVFNLGGEFFALRNSCPHQGGELCKGNLTGFVTSTGPGEYLYSRQGEILRCPWHGWEFDVRTGQSWFDPARVRVRRYDVSVEPEEPEKSEEPIDAAPAPAPGLVQGPYVAETYSVTLEQRNILVDVPG